MRLRLASLALLAALVAPGTDASQVFGDAGFGLRTTREFALPVIEDIRSFLEERGYVSTRRVHVRKNGFLRAAFETKEGADVSIYGTVDCLKVSISEPGRNGASIAPGQASKLRDELMARLRTLPAPRAEVFDLAPAEQCRASPPTH